MKNLFRLTVYLINGRGKIDYSFVTGESQAVTKVSGDKIFAGGKQTQGVIEIEALKSVEQSYSHPTLV
jgi:Cu+-exporting ATPase